MALPLDEQEDRINKRKVQEEEKKPSVQQLSLAIPSTVEEDEQMKRAMALSLQSTNQTGVQQFSAVATCPTTDAIYTIDQSPLFTATGARTIGTHTGGR